MCSALAKVASSSPKLADRYSAEALDCKVSRFGVLGELGVAGYMLVKFSDGIS